MQESGEQFIIINKCNRSVSLRYVHQTVIEAILAF